MVTSQRWSLPQIWLYFTPIKSRLCQRAWIFSLEVFLTSFWSLFLCLCSSPYENDRNIQSCDRTWCTHTYWLSVALFLSLSLRFFLLLYLGVDVIKRPLSSNSTNPVIFVLWPKCLELLYEGQQGEPVRKLVLYVTLRKVELGLICKQGHNVNTLFQLQRLDLITFEHNCDYDCCIAWTPKFSSWALKARSC